MNEPPKLGQFVGTIHGKVVVNFAIEFMPGDWYADDKEHAKRRTAEFAERYASNVFGHLEHHIEVETEAVEVLETGE